MPGRYAACPTFRHSSGGKSIPYLGRRLVPVPETLPVGSAVRAAPGSRVDLLAAQKLGAATQSWRIADINASTDLLSAVAGAGAVVLVPSPFAP